MLRILLCLLFAVISLQVYAQTADSLYVVTYTTGSAWDFSKSPSDQPYFKEHSARLGQFRKSGSIKFGARVGEKGLIVIAMPSWSAARQWLSEDPAVVNKLFNAEIEPLNIFYSGCLENPG
jgi:uncharacterized protein YciI